MIKPNLQVRILPLWAGVQLSGAPADAPVAALNDWLHNHYRGYVVDESRPLDVDGRFWLKRGSVKS